jgi:hypothetical protein
VCGQNVEFFNVKSDVCELFSTTVNNALKGELYKCNANMKFNQECLRYKLYPHFAKVKIPNTLFSYKFTCEKAQLFTLKDEIKLLYIKNQI